jgi:hypothetical protein
MSGKIPILQQVSGIRSDRATDWPRVEDGMPAMTI